MTTTDLPGTRTDTRPHPRSTGSALAKAATSGAFVALWTSGYIVGTFGTRAMPPLALNFWRFTLAAALLALVAVATRAPWPRTPRAWAHLVVTGVLLQATQFGGVYIGLASGVPAALSSLIIGAAPLLVAVGATALLGERMSRRGWLGSALGLAGVALALAGNLRGGGGAGIAATLVGMVGFAAGTLYQRKYGGAMDLRTGGAVQLGAGALATLPLALLVPIGGRTGIAVPVSLASVWPLAWMVAANSIGAITLLFVLVRRRGAAAGTGLLYLVPPLTAVVGAPLLHQPLGPLVWAGLAVAMAGVVLAQRGRR
ncbi:MAG TPA: EamA family transporter [Streptosporangiaceae bacterium]